VSKQHFLRGLFKCAYGSLFQRACETMQRCLIPFPHLFCRSFLLIMSYGPGNTISHPSHEWPRDVNGLGPGSGSNVNYQGIRVSGMPHAAPSNYADTTAFAGNGPTAANSQAIHHFAADVSDHVLGDFGLEEILFRSRRSCHSENNMVHPDPRRQSTKNFGMTALNYVMNHDTATVRKLCSMTKGQAADQYRLIGPMVNEEGTALQQGGDGLAELAATVMGRSYQANPFVGMAKTAITEGSGLWLIFTRMKRKDKELFEEAWLRAQAKLSATTITKEEMAAVQQDKEEMKRRAAGAGGVLPPPVVPGASAAAEASLKDGEAYKLMYTESLKPAAHAVSTRAELAPTEHWHKMCQFYPEDKPSPLFWHFWVPYHSPDGRPPDASIGGFGIPVYYGHFQHAMRGENAPTQKQILAARDVIFPRSRNQDHREAMGKLDRMECYFRVAKI
jgi:hypothetical protein